MVLFYMFCFVFLHQNRPIKTHRHRSIKTHLVQLIYLFREIYDLWEYVISVNPIKVDMTQNQAKNRDEKIMFKKMRIYK